MRQILTGARVFDGATLHPAGLAVVIDGGTIAAVTPEACAPTGDTRRMAGILAPAFIDLQVNGGGGEMIGADTTPAQIAAICATHRRLGAAGVLPTLISDTPEVTAQVVAAGVNAVGAPGFLGLHLEGPHLDPRRCGAHDPARIRPMQAEDLARLCEAARRLPALMVTLAPESVTPEQIAALSRAGAVVSIGHSDCSCEAARAAIAAGARCVTHLFNAMSQLGARAPGLVGAALESGVAAGVIADGVHVHPASLRAALAARRDGLFLVTDCMAFAGWDAAEMTLQGRRILRRDGRLTLVDGTLAGADLTLAEAIRTLVQAVGADPARALAMASRIPAEVIGADARHGTLAPGRPADLVLLRDDYSLAACWMDGARLDDWTSAPSESA